ncbi:MAG: zinc-binding dehydrogenase [Bacteroidota bacterium]
MQALLLNSDKELSIQELPKPSPGQGQALVKIHAAALNHRDLWIQKGLYPGIELPSVLGSDGAGVVEEVGHGVDKSWLGKEVLVYPALGWPSKQDWPSRDYRVLGMPQDGTMAEYLCIDAANLYEKPKHLSYPQAAACSLAGLTAWRALVIRAGLRSGERVLITGIGGGVAQMGLQFAVKAGAQVYVSSSSPKKIAAAESMGAAGGINYKDEDWPEQLKALSGGIDLVLDSSPLADLNRYLRFLNTGGRIAYYGATATREAHLNLGKFFFKQISLLGSTMGSMGDFGDMLDFISEHEIDIPVDSTYPLSDFKAAFERMEKGEQMGKIVLLPQ